MLSKFVLPHTRPENYKLSSRRSLTYLDYWNLYLFLLLAHEATQRFLHTWGARSRERNTSHFLSRDHVPGRCTRSVKVLTDRIVKMHAYPMAYGGFSDVWRCQLGGKQQPLEWVAVKATRPTISNPKESEVKHKAVVQELDVWVGLDHPNILPLWGITFGFGPFPAFVCPWVDNGTLSEYLEEFEALLDLKKRMFLLADVAAGLEYLHGDLSGSNILIFEGGQARLSDFGLSAVVERVSDTTVSGISFPGNIRWAAPELLGGFKEDSRATQLSSPQTDVYSFGGIMLQTLTGKLPFHRVQRVAQIVIMVSRGHKPEREFRWDGVKIPDVLWEFIQTCWGHPSERPSSEDIVHFIDYQLW